MQKQHIICRNNRASSLIYAVKIPAQVYKRWDMGFLQNYFDLSMATALADLKCPGPNAEATLINTAMTTCKNNIIPGYAKTLDELIGNCPNLSENPSPEGRAEKNDKEKKREDCE